MIVITKTELVIIVLASTTHEVNSSHRESSNSNVSCETNSGAPG